MWTKQELLEALSTELLEHKISDNITIDEVTIDSRKTPKSGLFIALVGENNNGHDFLDQAFSNGAALALISDKKNIKDRQFLLVKDTFKALYKLAEFSRHRSHAKIIAITGSVGKTGTKEMLKSAFSTQGKTFATIGNLNNHFGVPLSLCNFSKDCAYGIFEMGMNHLGEIEPLSRLVHPDLAIITNVGPAHIEFFKNEEEIALAKSEIFSGLKKDGLALLNQDNKHYEFLKKRAAKSLSFGSEKNSDYQILSSKISSSNDSEITVKLKNNREISYKISTSNSATIFNSIIVIACLDLLGSDLKKALESFQNLETPAGRGKISEIKINQKNITIIDDSYNASLLSIKSGLDHAVRLKNSLHKKRVVTALGDMRELGEKSVELHREIIDYLASLHIDFAILVGSEMSKSATILPKNSYKTFTDSTAAALETEGFLQDDDILYIKGSRGMKMEKIIEKLT